jgi:hypothetical protein
VLVDVSLAGSLPKRCRCARPPLLSEAESRRHSLEGVAMAEAEPGVPMAEAEGGAAASRGEAALGRVAARGVLGP